MTNDKKVEQLNNEELEQVEGGTGRQSGLLSHELTHIIQQSPSKIASTTDGVTKVISTEAGKGDV